MFIHKSNHKNYYCLGVEITRTSEVRRAGGDEVVGEGTGSRQWNCVSRVRGVAYFSVDYCAVCMACVCTYWSSQPCSFAICVYYIRMSAYSYFYIE